MQARPVWEPDFCWVCAMLKPPNDTRKMIYQFGKGHWELIPTGKILCDRG